MDCFHILYVDRYRWKDSWKARWVQSDYWRAIQGPRIATNENKIHIVAHIWKTFLSQIWGGGCNVLKKILGIKKYFRKKIFCHLMFSSCFFYARSFSNIFRMYFVWKYWKVPLHLLIKWEVVSPNSRYREF